MDFELVLALAVCMQLGYPTAILVCKLIKSLQNIQNLHILKSFKHVEVSFFIVFSQKKQTTQTFKNTTTHSNPPTNPTNPSLHHPTASCEVPELPVVQGAIGIDFFHKGQIHRDLPRFLPHRFQGRVDPVESTGPGKSRPGKDRLGRNFPAFFFVSTRWIFQRRKPLEV